MSFAKAACDYADDVIEGKIPACLYVRQACERFVSDLQREELKLDVKEAERWCKNLERLPHVKGKWAAKKELLKLSPYQIFCTVNIFGWKVGERRRFKVVYIEVPRKNGKTFWVAGMGVGMISWENEQGAEVYCGATSEKQAMEVFKPAKLICSKLQNLRGKYGITVNAKSIVKMMDGSKFEPVIGNPGDGASPSCGIVDEFHEHDKSDLVDTFETGMGARVNPLLIHITTAGSDMGSPCYAKRKDVIDILSGVIKDDRTFGIIYTLDEGDQWDTIEAQKKANPNYGVSVDEEFLKGQLEQARRSATKQVAYKTKHLNLWVGAKAAWMNMLAFQRCRKKINIEDFKGRECYIALDLATKIDIAAMTLMFPANGKYAFFHKHYLPEERIFHGDTPNSTRYKAWQSVGLLTTTPGDVIDYNYIKDDLREALSTFNVQEIVFDPWQATQLSSEMIEEGAPMVEYRATVQNFSEPMKELEALILRKAVEFDHSDDVIMWMYGNVVAKMDKKDNIYPNKEHPENKIDGVISDIMALGRYITNTNLGQLGEDYQLLVV